MDVYYCHDCKLEFRPFFNSFYNILLNFPSIDSKLPVNLKQCIDNQFSPKLDDCIPTCKNCKNSNVSK